MGAIFHHFPRWLKAPIPETRLGEVPQQAS
jgi:hypothetical protein